MLIEAQDLHKEYGATLAVDNLNLAVDKGEVFGFLGPNGAGKTTTIKMLLGLVRPTSGTSSVLGFPPGDPRMMGRVGFLPEHFRFPHWLTAADFLDLHGRLYGLSAAARRERIPRLLARVGLADRADSHLGAFSKGMSQRVGLAQALLNDPDLVFLDEPTSGLDPLGRREVRDLIRELRAAGVTVFLNSHFLSEVEVVCDRVAIVKRGRIVRGGTLAQLTGGAVEVRIRAAGLTPEIVRGLARWGQVAPEGVPEGAPVGGAEPDFGQSASRLRTEPSAPQQQERDVGLVILSIESEDVLPVIAAWLRQSGVRLYELAPARLSLEELFVRTVGAA